MNGSYWRCPQCVLLYQGVHGGLCLTHRVPLVPADPPEEEDPLVGRVLGGRYRLLDCIGVGGMARVYRALHVQLRREVAVKVLASRYAAVPVFRHRFVREARAANLLRHDHVIDIHDIVEDDDIVFLVMNLLHGQSLAERVAGGPLAPDDVVAWITPVASALARAHALGIVHRDVKPGNIFLSQEHGRTHVRLLDFGIAHVRSDDTLTLRTDLLGSPDYMAPEQLSGGFCSPATDLYALGVTLFECLTGRVPFEESGPTVSLRRLHSRPPDVRTLCPTTPEWLAALTMSLLEREPIDRPATAATVVDELRRISDSLRPRPPEVRSNLDELRDRAARARLSAAAAWPTSNPPEWVARSFDEVDTQLEALAGHFRTSHDLAERAIRAARTRDEGHLARADALKEALASLERATAHADAAEATATPLAERATAATEAVAAAQEALRGADDTWAITDGSLAAMQALGRAAEGCANARAAHQEAHAALVVARRAEAEAEERVATQRAAIVAEQEAVAQEGEAIRRENAALGRAIADCHRALRVELEVLERYLANSPGAP